MATKQILSETVQNEAFTMALQGHTWNKGRSKRTGAAFYLIPSRSIPGTAHRCTSYGCTCSSNRWRGRCIHVEAVKLYERWEAVQAPRFESESDVLTGWSFG